MLKANPFVLYASIASLLVGLVGGYKYAHNADAAKDAAAERSAEVKYAAAVDYGNRRVAELVVDNNRKQANYDLLKKETPTVAYVYVHDQPTGDAVFPYGFVGVWNAALRGEAFTSATSVIDPATPTRVTAGALLDNFVANAQRCDVTTRQLNALIDWEQETNK